MLSQFRVENDWYARRHAEAALAVSHDVYEDLEHHFTEAGARGGFSPNLLFDVQYYKKVSAWNPDQHDADPRRDYIQRGAALGYSPTPFFSEKWFRHYNKVEASLIDQGNLISGYAHFLLNNYEKRATPFFNQALLDENGTSLDLFRNYLSRLHGNSMAGADAFPLFDPEFYASQYSLEESRLEAMCGVRKFAYHFLATGITQGYSPFPDFDEAFYLHRHPDVVDAIKSGFIASAIEHYLLFGIAENRPCNDAFDVRAYAELNPEIGREIKRLNLSGASEHFYSVGMKRGLRCSRPIFQIPLDKNQAKIAYQRRAEVSAHLTKGGDPKFFEQPIEPDFSVIVPVYNNFAMTAHFLRALYLVQRAYAGEVSFEVIVVDNGSSDATLDLETYFPGIVLVREEKPVGYLGACNLGAQVARGRYHLYSNNDMEIEFELFSNAKKSFEADEKIGALGARILQMDGLMQEAGSYVLPDGAGQGFKRDALPFDQDVKRSREVEFCSGCLLFVRADALPTQPVFDPLFAPGYYEETDLCFRLRDAGYKVIYDPSLVCYHFEFASYSKGRPASVSAAIMHRNRKSFARKHRRVLSAKSTLPTDNPKIQAFRLGRPGKHILFVDDLPPDPRLGSGFPRYKDIVDVLYGSDWRVTIWDLHGGGRVDLDYLGLDGLEVKHGVNQPEIEAFVRREAHDIDALWVGRTHNFSLGRRLAQLLRSLNPNAKVVLDTEAIASSRGNALLALTNSEQKPLAPEIRSEIGSVDDIDHLVVVNDIDQQVLPTEMRDKSHVLGFSFEPVDEETLPGFDSREGVFFAGAFHSPVSPNYDSIVWFADKIWPLIKDEGDDVKASIVGIWGQNVDVPKVLKQRDMTVVGPVDEIDPWILSHRVAIAPTRFAGGLPHKVLKMQSLGVPVVLTSILARQLGISEATYPALASCVHDDATAFARACVRLNSDRDYWNEVRDEGLKLVRDLCDPDEFANSVLELVQE